MASAQSDTPFLKTAMDVFARATTNSEVLSLNLSGLIILLVLKVAVVAFSLMSGGASARSAVSSYSEADLTGGMCFILYTSGAETCGQLQSRPQPAPLVARPSSLKPS